MIGSTRIYKQCLTGWRLNVRDTANNRFTQRPATNINTLDMVLVHKLIVSACLTFYEHLTTLNYVVKKKTNI